MIYTAIKCLLKLSFCIFFFAGCAIAPENDSGTCAKPEVLAEFEVPVDATAVLLPVKFEGQEYTFILDTGSNSTVFDASLKHKLGKRILWPEKGKGARGESFRVEDFPAPNAYIGPLNLRDGGRIVKVADLHTLSSHWGREIHGIIGMNFLRKHVIQIDFDEAKVLFLEPHKETGIFSFYKPAVNKHPAWGEQIPIKYKLFESFPYIQGTFADGTCVDFLIDSGSTSTGIFGKLESKVFKKLCSSVENWEIQVGSKVMTIGSSSYVASKAAFIEKFSTGSFVYQDVFFKEDNQSRLGLLFLSRHLVTFDFPNKKIYLKKRESFDAIKKRPFQFPEFGLNLYYNGDDFSVSSLDPNSLAYKSGLRKGDIIVKINRYDVTSYSLTKFLKLSDSLLSSNAGDLIITIRRAESVKRMIIPR